MVEPRSFPLNFGNVISTIGGMRQIKSERIGRFLVIEQLDERGRLYKTVFLDYIPVARFDVHQINERRLASVDLVERGICDPKTAGNLCGFHRNTVVRLVRAKRLLGLDAILNDALRPHAIHGLSFTGSPRRYFQNRL